MRRVILLGLAALTATACGGHPSRTRRVAPSDDVLTGIWSVTLRLERPMSFRTERARLPLSVNGTVALLPFDADGRSEGELTDPTHAGVYNIPIQAIEMPGFDAGVIPSVAARLVTQRSGADSVYLVLNPDHPRHTLRMSGVRDADGLHGRWEAESPLLGGGEFTLRHHVR